MRLLNLAVQLALSGDRKKNFLLGAVIKRKDGAIVVATNTNTQTPHPNAHAEVRVLRKADLGCTLYVARVLRTTGEWALAKPCVKCQALIRNRGVKRVYYTVGPDEYRVWDVQKQREP
jgi:tRNA(Arg) A34 adenosine deaminase TadA